MTERKKPGPKPKCKECGRKEGMGHEDDCPVGLGVVDQAPVAQAAAQAAGAAQAYAARIWEGQSISLPRNERLKRVKAALEAQGLSMEGVEL